MLLNKQFLKYFVVLVLPITLGVFACENAFAYSATLNVSSSIDLNILPLDSEVSIKQEWAEVITNCRGGYNLSIATSTSSNLYLNGDGSGSATFTAVDGTSTLANSTNKWGYSLANNASSSTVFSPLSTTAAAIRTTSQTASAEDIDEQILINYGAKADSSLSPGSYYMANSGAIRYYLTMDPSCASYTVSFNANGGTGTMTSQDIVTGTATKLSSASSLVAPTTASYTDAENNTVTGDANKRWTFWGWNTAADGTGDWYKDRESVTNLTTTGSTITLYAQWEQPTLADLTTTTPGANKTIDHNTMQDMSPAACYNSTKFTAIGTAYGQATLTDSRDGTARTYTVAKLPDNACWMTQNLNLGTSTAITLTPDDTDITTDFTLPASDPNDFSTASTTANYNKPTVLNNMTVPSYNVNGTAYNNKINAYYSHAAAVAGSNMSRNPTTSICPKNWDLPLSGQYYRLKMIGSIYTYNSTISSYAGKNAGNEPYYFIYGGYRRAAGNTVSSTYFYNPTTYGYYWTPGGTSTGNAGTGVYVNGDGLYNGSGGTNYASYLGLSLRCVASAGKATVHYDKNNANAIGTVSSQVNVEINSTLAAANGYTLTGYRLEGWNTDPYGNGIDLMPNVSPLSALGLYDGQEITLYAKWQPIYTITYINNCATFNTGCSTNTSNVTSRQNIDLTNNPSTGTETATLGGQTKFTQSGWKIAAWSTVPNPDPNSGDPFTLYTPGSTYTVPSGSVPGDSITLYAVWKQTYTLQYDGNGAENASTGMGTTDSGTGLKGVRHTNVVEGDTFDLFASNYKRAGYGFVGWSTDANAWSKLTDNDSTNDAKIWGPNEIFTAPARSGDILTLYAVWAPAETSGGNPVYLQSWSGCSTMTASAYNSATGELTVAKDSVTALTDQRDGEIYAVAKLADGNCWMIENLKLADKHQENGNTVDTTLTTSNTNILATNSSLPLTNIYSSSTTSNHLSPSSSQNSTGDVNYGWCTASSAACQNQSRLNTANTVADTTPSISQTVSSANAHTNFNGDIYSYGNYYNWYSSTAGYGTYEINDAATILDGDICPIGWHLPYGYYDSTVKGGNTSGGFYYLLRSMFATNNNNASSNKLRSFPNNYIYSGGWNTSSAVGSGLNGRYWSNTAYTAERAYQLSIDQNGVTPFSVNLKYQGNSVRCVMNDNYTVVFNRNSGSGTMHNQTIAKDVATTLATNTFTRSNYDFVGWNTAADGSGTYYADGASVTNIAPDGQAVTLYAQWEKSCAASKVCYYDNGANSSTTMGDQTVDSSATGIELWASNFQYAGHGFAGWNTSRDGTGTYLGPNEAIASTTTISINSIKSNGLKLYAIWLEPEKDSNNNELTFQTQNLMNVTLSDNSTLALKPNGYVTALKDSRDGQVYAVVKEADDHYWMMENLRFNGRDASGNLVTINSSNTNNPTSGFALSSPQDPTVTTWCNTNDTTCDDAVRFATNSTMSTVSSMTAANNSVYSYGNYYNWYTATAGRGTYSVNTVNQNVTGDICPAGWRLPDGGNFDKGFDNDYWNLAYELIGDIPESAVSDPTSAPYYTDSYGDEGTNASTIFRKYPQNYLLNGRVTTSFVDGTGKDLRGENGSVYTRTANSANGVNFFYLERARVNPGNNTNYKWHGRGVRCMRSAQYTVKFNANGGSGTMNDQFVNAHKTVALDSNTFTAPSSSYFEGWNTKADGTGYDYVDGDSIRDIASVNGSITLYARWGLSCASGKICYKADASNASGTMGNQTVGTSATSATLLASNFSRTGYGFAGWSDVRNYKTNRYAHFYGPQQDITFTAGKYTGSNRGLTLYAVWIESAGNMQNWSGCSSLTQATYNSDGTINAGLSSITALTDSRDSQTYAIARLPDGKCWSIENLRLTSGITLSSSNTHNPLSGFTSLATNSTSWCTTYDSDCQDVSRLRTTNTTSRASNPTVNTDINLYSYGNYYNWYSATAGRGKYATTSKASGDICPAGWHLPTGTASGEYGALTNSLGGYKNNSNVAQTMNTSTSPTLAQMSKRLRSFPVNILYGGVVNGTSINSRGGTTQYATATGKSCASSGGGSGTTGCHYIFVINSNGVFPGNTDGGKQYGRPVRCIAGT